MTGVDQLTREFTELFGRYEHALKQAGYLRRTPEAQADWNRFARELGPAFFDAVVASNIAPKLLGDPPKKQMNNLTWPAVAPPRNAVELFEQGICRVRNNFFHGEKFIGNPQQQERDAILISEALAVLRAAKDEIPGVGALI